MNKEQEHINNFNAYPLYFYPIFKEKIWGGTSLKSLNKAIPKENIGESWELSMVDDDISTIKNGVYKNLSLETLLKKFPLEILGKKAYEKFGVQFPLLFKFLDAKTDLSIQVHPNDEIAQKRHKSFGKTEMWYIIDAQPDARVILGFKKDSSPDEFLSYLDNKKLPLLLKEYPVKKGDAFIIETGTIHAIGGGMLLAEIQQTSDITYRVYDWDRLDQSGTPRELHLDYALEAINFKAKNNKIDYQKNDNEINNIVVNQYFTTNFLKITKKVSLTKKECFHVYICTEGSGEIRMNNLSYSFTEGDTFLIPATIKTFEIEGNATVLQIYI